MFREIVAIYKDLNISAMLLRYALGITFDIFLKLNVIRTRCSAKPGVQRVHPVEQM